MNENTHKASVLLMEMQLRVEWVRLENVSAERENSLGGWLLDHAGAIAHYSKEFEALKLELLAISQPPNPAGPGQMAVIHDTPVIGEWNMFGNFCVIWAAGTCDEPPLPVSALETQTWRVTA